MSVYNVSLLLATLSCYVLHCLGKVLFNRNQWIAMAHPVVKASLVGASEISYLIALKLKVKTG